MQTNRHDPSQRPWTLLATLAPAAFGLGACDVVTLDPSWETRWVVDAFEGELGIEEFLPPEVTVTEDGEAFLLDVPGASAASTLRELCPPCAEAEGTMAPKPGFTASLSGSSPFPEDVRSVEIAGGRVFFTIENGFGFDPIRPSGGERGSLTIVLRGGEGTGRVVAEHILDGTTDALPPGSSVTLEIPLEPGPVTEPLRFEATLVSPEGAPAPIHVDRTFGVDVVFADLTFASVRLFMPATDVSMDPLDLDVEDVEEDVVERVEAGAIELLVENDFAADLDMELVIQGPQTPAIHRDVTIGPGSSVARVEFTVDEIRSVLGYAGVTLSGAGVARGAEDGELDVRPGQRVELVGRMDLMFRLGGDG